MGVTMPEAMTTRERLIAQLCTLSYADIKGIEARRVTEYLQDVLATIEYIKTFHHIRYYESGQTSERANSRN